MFLKCWHSFIQSRMLSWRPFQADGAETEKTRRASSVRVLGTTSLCASVDRREAANLLDRVVSTSSAPCRRGGPPCSQCVPALATSAVTAVAVWMESGGSTGWRPVPECFGPVAVCRWSLPVHRAVERCSSPAGLRRCCKRLSWRRLQTTRCGCGAERACENCTPLRLIWHDCQSWGDCPVSRRVTLQYTSQVANSRRCRQFFD